MTTSIRYRRAFSAVVLLIVFGLTGCRPVDHWSVFEPDFAQHYGDDPAPATLITRDLRPAAAEEVKAPAVNDGVLKVSLEEAVMLAMRGNRDLTVAQLQPVITDAFERIERGRFDPELFAEGSYSEEVATEVARSTGTQFPVEGSDSGTAVGIRQELPTGTDVEVGLSHDRTISSRSPELQRARIGLTVTQQLLRGMGPAVNLARVRQARLDTVASRYELRGFAEALLADTEIAYWEYALAQRRIAIFEKSLDFAKKQADEVAQRIKVGVLAETEAAAANAEVAINEQALIEARSNMEDRRLRLLRLMNPVGDDSFDLVIESSSPPDTDIAPISDVADRTRLALRMRPDLNESRLRLEQKRLETIVTRNGVLPRLELFAALGKTGYGDTFGEPYEDLDGDNYDATVGIRFSHYLHNRAAEGRHRAAEASRAQAAAAVANLEQIVRLDVRLAINEIKRARQQIAASKVTRELQEQTLRAEQQRFGVGARTALDVARAQRDLLESQNREVEALIAYRVALVQLYVAEGSLLERRGITLSGRVAAGGPAR